MPLANRFRDSTQRLISHYGHVKTYEKVEGQAYNIDTQMLESTFSYYDVKMFKTEPKEREVKSPNLINKETAVIMIAASSLPFKPKINDRIKETSFDTEVIFNVEAVKENWAGDQIASWRLICTRS